jgi:hypothetical protein
MSRPPRSCSGARGDRDHRTHSVRTNVLRSVACALAVLGAGVTLSCSIPNQTAGDKIGDLPDRASFVDNGVSKFMERRCGGLDCHGQQGRPLRLYGQWGLRLKATETGERNGEVTTEEELTENYLAVVGLEPENLAACFASKGVEFATFQLLKKPLDIENQGIRHKGGPVLRPTQNDFGWQCLYGWASGQVDKKQCEEAAKVQ